MGHEVGQLISDPFFIEMFARLADEITNRDYQVLLCRVTDTSEGWLERIVQSQRQDGIVLVGQSDQDAAINKAAAIYKPIVVWGSQLPNRNYCSVGTDNIAGARSGVAHLVSLGRKRIAFLGMPQLPEIRLRHQGYHEALNAAGIEPDLNLSILAPFSFDGAHAAALGLVQSGVEFDAIFAASDVIALACIQALSSRGISIPADVGVVGYDDIANAAQAVPPLTTVRQDLALGARAIVDLLFRKIAGEQTASVVLEPRLTIRKSCGTSLANA
jgi:DNA-binding LacI/PurR family transcriptional regulator